MAISYLLKAVMEVFCSGKSISLPGRFPCIAAEYMHGELHPCTFSGAAQIWESGTATTHGRGVSDLSRCILDMGSWTHGHSMELHNAE